MPLTWPPPNKERLTEQGLPDDAGQAVDIVKYGKSIVNRFWTSHASTAHGFMYWYAYAALLSAGGASLLAPLLDSGSFSNEVVLEQRCMDAQALRATECYAAREVSPVIMMQSLCRLLLSNAGACSTFMGVFGFRKEHDFASAVVQRLEDMQYYCAITVWSDAGGGKCL